MPPLEAVIVLVSIMMSVGWDEQRQTVEFEDTATSAERISKEQPRYSNMSVFQRKIDRCMVKTELADRSRACTELKMLPTSGSLVMRI